MRVSLSVSPHFGARLERLITLPPRSPSNVIPTAPPTAPIVAGCWRLTTLADVNALRGHVLRWQQQVDAGHGGAGASTGAASPSSQKTVIASVLAQIKGYREQRDVRPEIWPYIVDFNHTEPLTHPDSLLGVAFLNQRSNFLYALQAKPAAAIAADGQDPLKGVGRGLLYAMMKRLETLGDLKPLIFEPVVGSLPFYRRLFGRPAKYFRPLNRHFPDDPGHVDMVMVDTPGVNAFLKRNQARYPNPNASADSL